MDAPELLVAINAAFDGVAKPVLSLRQFSLTDRKGMSGSITQAEWLEAGRRRIDTKWQDIPDTEIEECGVVLSHMEAADFQYYLPAYTTYSLKHSRVPIWESPILDMTTYSLCPDRKDVNLRRYKLSQLSLLTRP